MIVRELIELLQTVRPDAEVYVIDPGTDWLCPSHVEIEEGPGDELSVRFVGYAGEAVGRA